MLLIFSYDRRRVERHHEEEQTAMASKQKVEELKNQGNDCMKNENYPEAVLHYSHAIQIDGKNHFLYSNRSLAFLKMQQYYHSLQDANESIRLQPSWPKGYFRQGEVYFKVEDFTSALMAYSRAKQLDPSDSGVQNAINRTSKEIARVNKEEKMKPLKYGGLGFLFAVALILGDFFVAKQPSIMLGIGHIGVLLAFTFLGLAVWKISSMLILSKKDSLLEPPLDLFKEEQSEETQNANEPSSHTEKHRKKTSGRQRYKMGKT